MNNSKNILGLSTVLLVLCLGFGACDDCEDPTNPECENYDPCWGKTPTNADFITYERNGDFGAPDDEVFFPTDTALTGATIKFEAVDSLDEYYWKIGNDERVFRSKSFKLNFSGFLGTIDIMLIGKKYDQNLCFPDDDGVDTMVKSLTFIPYLDSPVYGKYRGYDTDEPDSVYTIEFIGNSISKGLINFPRGCTAYEKIPAGIGFETFVFNSFGYPQCQDPIGIGYLVLL